MVADVTQCPLRKVVIIDVDRAPQRRRQVRPGAAAAGRQDLADAPVAALHPAVGLGMVRRNEAVLKVRCGTDPVAARLAPRLTFAGGATAIGKFLAVSGQDLADLPGGSLEKMGQKALGAGGGLFGPDLDLNPTGGAVAGGEPVATRVLVGQLRQVRAVAMHNARGIVFEGLAGQFATLRAGQQGLEIRDPLAAQAAVEAGAGDTLMEELAGHRQRVIQGQQQGLTPGHPHRLLGGGEGGLQAVRAVGTVGIILPSSPLRTVALRR